MEAASTFTRPLTGVSGLSIRKHIDKVIYGKSDHYVGAEREEIYSSMEMSVSEDTMRVLLSFQIR